MTHGVDPRLIDALSQSQRACLKLVRAGFTSKEIARQTGLSDKTVDQYMSRAVATLGVVNRHAAAEALERAENASIKVTELKPLALAPEPPNGPSPLLPDVVSRVGATEQMKEGGQEVSRFRLSHRPVWLPPVGGGRHRFDVPTRIGALLRIGFAALVAMAAIITLMRGAILLLMP